MFINELDKKVFTTSRGAGDGGSGNFGRWLRRQLELELPDQKLEFLLRLGVSRQPQLSTVGRRQMDIDHLHGGELLQNAACGQSRRQRVQPTLQGDLHAVGQEGDEDMGLDPSLVVVEHRANRQVLLQSFLITLFPQPICQNEERSLAQA